MGIVLEAVLFDMDGTLVDTEPYWMAAEWALVEEFGGTWSDEHQQNLVGNALITSAEYLRLHGGIALEPDAIVERLLDHVVVSATEEMPWRPGARELLADLKSAGVPTALVTMSYTRLAKIMVELLPAGTFTAVVTGDQVADGKPHPEAYLTAAARLGVDPAACVAVEDSPTGLASAEAAGCVVVAVPHRVPVSPAPRRRFVDSLRELNVDVLRAMIDSSD